MKKRIPWESGNNLGYNFHAVFGNPLESKLVTSEQAKGSSQALSRAVM